MPELPEVETIVRGIAPIITGKRITNVIVRESRLRYEVPENLPELITNETISSISRRGKYMLIKVGHGHLLLHFGMSGSLQLSKLNVKQEKHDHVEFQIEQDWILRFRDPRKFGSVLHVKGHPYAHKLLTNLGREPLLNYFTGSDLYKASRRKKSIEVKNFLMDEKVVAGIGNIYASEILYDAGIHPEKQANHISEDEYESLAKSIKKILQAAIENGGTTLEDFPTPFMDPTGATGNYQRKLKVYGRAGWPCFHCGTEISKIEQRSVNTYFCNNCQKM